MKTKQLGFALATLLLSTAALATTLLQSSNIPLTGGTVAPHQTLSIALDQLANGSLYQVSCKINHINNQKNQLTLMVSSGVVGGTVLNGSTVGPQFKLPQTNNTFQINNIANFNTLTITNLDQNDSVLISDCFASPQN